MAKIVRSFLIPCFRFHLFWALLSLEWGLLPLVWRLFEFVFLSFVTSRLSKLTLWTILLVGFLFIFFIILGRSFLLILPFNKISLILSDSTWFIYISIFIWTSFLVLISLIFFIKSTRILIVNSLIIILFFACIPTIFLVLKLRLPLRILLLSKFIKWSLLALFNFRIFGLEIELLYHLLELLFFYLLLLWFLVRFWIIIHVLSFLDCLISYWIFQWFLRLL